MLLYGVGIIPHTVRSTRSADIHVVLSPLKPQYLKSQAASLPLQHPQPPCTWPNQKRRQVHHWVGSFCCPHRAEITTLFTTFSLLSCIPSPLPPTPFPLKPRSPGNFLLPKFFCSASTPRPILGVNTKLSGPGKMGSLDSA